MKKSLTLIAITLLAALTAYPVFAMGPAWSGHNNEMRFTGAGPGYHHMTNGYGHQRFQHRKGEETCWNNQTAYQGMHRQGRHMGPQTDHMRRF